MQLASENRILKKQLDELHDENMKLVSEVEDQINSRIKQEQEKLARTQIQRKILKKYSHPYSK